MRRLFFLIFILLPLWSWSQSGAAKRALKALEDQDMEKVEKHLLKGLEKDSLDPMLFYVMARFMVEGPVVNIDSANNLERVARLELHALTVDVTEKYEKSGLSETELNELRSELDELGFIRARNENSEEGYIDYLDKFPGSKQHPQATLLRDSVAFGTASQENTYKSYKAFMHKYPDAVDFAEAEKRYHKLLFEVSTRSGTLIDLENFLEAYPETPYRQSVESEIFMLRTAVPGRENYMSIIQDYPATRIGRDARNYLYYLMRDELMSRDRQLWGDSLLEMDRINSDFWLATFTKEEVNFIDNDGAERLTMDREDLFISYTCEPLTEALVLANNKLISRKGEEVYAGAFDNIEFLDNGLIIVSQRGRKGVITTWGTTVLPIDYLDIRLVDNLFLLAKRGGKSSLFSIAGLQLTEPVLDDVQVVGEKLILYNEDRMSIHPISDLNRAVVNRNPMEFFWVDDMEILKNGTIWVQKGNQEALLDSTMKPLIPQEIQQIEILEEGFLCIKPTNVKIYSSDLLQKFTTEEKLLDFNERYARFTAPESEALFDLPSFRFIAFPDSVMLTGSRFAITQTTAGVKLYANSAQTIDLPEFQRWLLMKQTDTEKLMVSASGKEYIVETNLLSELPRNTDVSLLNDSLFIVEQNRKKGIWNTQSEKFIVPPRYDALANFDGRDISLFQNKKFGLYRVNDNSLIPPISEKLVTAFGDSLFMIVQKGKKSLINNRQDISVPAEFDEISPWSDSLALVKKGQDWHIFNMSSQVLSSDAIRNPRFIESADERFMIVFLEQKFGVFSNKNGEIIPATFDDVLNIGTNDEPLFFTETYVDAAELHVVIYFDKQGNLLLRQAVEPDFFDKIYCDE